MAALDSPGGGSCSFCLGLWLPCPTSPIPLGPSRGCAGTGKGVAAALLHLEAVAPSQGLERGWAPRSPALVGGEALRHRDLTSSLQLGLSLFGPESGRPLAPTCRGSLFPLAVVAPQIHPEPFCFSLAAAGLLGPS